MDKTNPGEPKNVALAAMTAHVNIKWVIAFDIGNAHATTNV
jgi:hypothetical protein